METGPDGELEPPRFRLALPVLTEMLEREALDPDSAREDWDEYSDELDEIEGLARVGILGQLKGAFDDVSAEEAEELRADAAGLVADSSALLQAAGRHVVARELLEAAAEVAPDSFVEELVVGLRARESWLSLVRARWLLHRGRCDEADEVARAAKKQCGEAVLVEALEQVLAAPRPLDGALPPIGELMGWGTMLMWPRDHWPDGSYVETLCVTAYGIPLFPVRSYRVVDDGPNRVIVVGREKLSSSERTYRWVVMLAPITVLLLTFLVAHVKSEDYRADSAVEDAHALEESGDGVAALTAYEAVLHDFSSNEDVDRSTLAPAAVAIARMLFTDIDEPLAPEQIDRVSRVVLRFRQLPGAWAGDDNDASDYVVDRLDRLADQLDADSLEGLEARQALLRLAASVAPASGRAAIERRVVVDDLAIARRLSADWPVFALERFASQPAEESAFERAVELASMLVGNPSLARQLAPSVERLRRSPRAVGEYELLLEDAAARVEAARVAASDSERQAALSSGHSDALTAGLSRFPGDQELIIAVAQLRLGDGELSEARALFDDLGAPGRLTDDALMMYASVLSESGAHDRAEEVLGRFVAVRLPAYQLAQRTYDAAATARAEALVERAQNGPMPDELQARLVGAFEEERQQSIFDEWLRDQLASDETLVEQSAELERHSAVVGACLSLSMVQLHHADEVSGEHRERLLAAAERSLMSIREQAEGVPDYHLGLGQVYHRMGKTSEGEAEIALALAHRDPELDLAAAKIYRELGLAERARQIAERVLAGGPMPEHDYAATLLSVMADSLEDKERYLQHVREPTFETQTELLDIRATRLVMEGRFEEADRTFGEVAERHGRDAERDAAAANNQGLAYLSRYRCTGDERFLQRGVDGLEAAVRLAPDNSLTVGNLADAALQQANIRVLSRSVRVRELLLSQTAARSLVDALADGAQKQSVRESLAGDAAYRRASELVRRHQILSPRQQVGYARERQNAARLEDLSALEDLVARVERAAPFASDDRRRERFLNGELDAELREDLDASVRNAEQVVEGARRGGDGPTLAAARYLLAGALGERAAVFLEATDAQRAIVEYEAVRQGWDAISVEQPLAWTRVLGAMLEIAAEDAGHRQALAPLLRRYALDLAVVHFVDTGEGARSALLEQPQMQAALRELRAAPTDRRPELGVWLLGRAIGDAELEASNAAARTDAVVVTNLRIRALLSPGDEDLRERAEHAR